MNAKQCLIGIDFGKPMCASPSLVEMLDHIGGDIDTEISLLLQKAYENKGVTFLTSACVSQITSDGLTYRKENAEYELKADKMLLAAGRTPIVDSIGLDAAGVEIHEFGIDTDEHMCTNVPNLYAAGDVTGKSMLAHTAYREAEVAVNHMLEKPDRMRYYTVPSVIYTNPEVASVGYTKAAAEERGHQVREVKIPLQYSGRYVAEVENGNGVCKLIVDTQFNRLLGVHL